MFWDCRRVNCFVQTLGGFFYSRLVSFFDMVQIYIPNVQWGALNFGYFGEFLRLSTQLARSYWRWKLNLEVPYDLLNNLTVL